MFENSWERISKSLYQFTGITQITVACTEETTKRQIKYLIVNSSSAIDSWSRANGIIPATVLQRTRCDILAYWTSDANGGAFTRIKTVILESRFCITTAPVNVPLSYNKSVGFEGKIINLIIRV